MRPWIWKRDRFLQSAEAGRGKGLWPRACVFLRHIKENRQYPPQKEARCCQQDGQTGLAYHVSLPGIGSSSQARLTQRRVFAPLHKVLHCGSKPPPARRLIEEGLGHVSQMRYHLSAPLRGHQRIHLRRSAECQDRIKWKSILT